MSQTEQSADNKTASQGPAQPGQVVVRVDRGFEYRGAHFAPNTYYRLRDEPANFVSWHIEHNLQGAVVPDGKVPAGVKVLDDPRPAAYDAAAAQRRAENEAILASQQPRPRTGVVAPAGQATVATTSENVFGSTAEGHSVPAGRTGPVGEHPAPTRQSESTAPAAPGPHAGNEPPVGGASVTPGPATAEANKPRLPRTAPGT